MYHPASSSSGSSDVLNRRGARTSASPSSASSSSSRTGQSAHAEDAHNHSDGHYDQPSHTQPSYATPSHHPHAPAPSSYTPAGPNGLTNPSSYTPQSAPPPSSSATSSRPFRAPYAGQYDANTSGYGSPITQSAYSSASSSASSTPRSNPYPTSSSSSTTSTYPASAAAYGYAESSNGALLSASSSFPTSSFPDPSASPTLGPQYGNGLTPTHTQRHAARAFHDGSSGGPRPLHTSDGYPPHPSVTRYSASSSPSPMDRRRNVQQNADSLRHYTIFMYGLCLLSLACMGVSVLTMGWQCVYLLIVLSICLCSFLFTLSLTRWIFTKDDQHQAMRVISEAIREGSEGFLRVQYTSIASIACIIAAALFLVYFFRASPSPHISSLTLAALTAVSYLVGAFCSGLAGYIGVWVSVRVNIRVSVAASKLNYSDSLLLSFRGGAVSACLSASLCILGLTVLYTLCHLAFSVMGGLPASHVPLLLAGYSFGGALVALFMQLGGGIYCFPADDTRVLTNHGFLFYEEIIAVEDYKDKVLFACYDNRLGQLVYRKAREWRYLSQADGLVDFTQANEAARWTAEADDRRGASNYLSLRVTGEHTMRVKLGYLYPSSTPTPCWQEAYSSLPAASLVPDGKPLMHSEPHQSPHPVHQFFKRVGDLFACQQEGCNWTCSALSSRGPSASLLSKKYHTATQHGVEFPAERLPIPDSRQLVRFQAFAPMGIGVGTASSQQLLADLDAALGFSDRANKECGSAGKVAERKQQMMATFLELYGFWLGDGSMADGKVTYENTKASDVAWLKEALPRAGLSASAYAVYEIAGGAVAIHITDKAWNAFFVAEYGRKYRFGKPAALAEVEEDMSGRPSASSSSSEALPVVASAVANAGQTLGQAFVAAHAAVLAALAAIPDSAKREASHQDDAAAVAQDAFAHMLVPRNIACHRLRVVQYCPVVVGGVISESLAVKSCAVVLNLSDPLHPNVSEKSSGSGQAATLAVLEAAIEDAEVDLSIGWMQTQQIPFPAVKPEHYPLFEQVGRLSMQASLATGASVIVAFGHMLVQPDWAATFGIQQQDARVLSVGRGRITVFKIERGGASPLFVVCAPHPGRSDRHTIAAHLRLAELLAKGALTPAAVEVVDSLLGQAGGEMVGSEEPNMKSVKWFASWVHHADRDQLRLIIRGLWRADGDWAHQRSRIFTSSPAFRDALMHLMLHAGYSTRFGVNNPAGTVYGWSKIGRTRETQKMIKPAEFEKMSEDEQKEYVPVRTNFDNWTVQFADPESEGAAQSNEPTMMREDIKFDKEFKGPAWCVKVDHPDHWIIAQRAVRGTRTDPRTGKQFRVVIRASRPVIVGNTKAADVGADMCGKIEAGIPEDDPRNPAVIADLVGDNVGDCAGSMADVFESIAAEIIGTMILGAALAEEAGIAHPEPFIFFPLLVHSLDLLVSGLGIVLVHARSDKEDPIDSMQRSYLISMACAAVGFVFACWFCLSTPTAPSAWWHYALCGLIGIAMSFALIRVTQYYTDYSFAPVKRIAAASATGHGTNVIAGLSVGLESTGIPILIICVSLWTAFALGQSSGLPSQSAGIFGTAVATMGMLCTAVFVLSMNNFGPIADNAGGICEMGGQSEDVRRITDRLDAVGNVTKAASKGYAVGGSALSCFVLFQAFLDEMSDFTGSSFASINLAQVEVVIGGLLGIAMIFVFAGWAISAVGSTAQKVVWEVRRQLKDSPGIMEGTEKPDYEQCVRIVTKAALSEMVAPAALALGLPIAVGFTFRLIGDATNRPLLGLEVVGAFMIVGTLAGLCMAVFMDNAGGAWDNAKKLIESRGEKGTEQHKAAVTGDTVGDPCKDTAGPAIHVIITTMATTILVLGPMFVGTSGAARLATP